MADFEEPRWRCKERIGNIMARLDKHAKGEVEMSPTQVAAARLYLDKTLPSLAATTNKNEHSGELTMSWKNEKGE